MKIKFLRFLTVGTILGGLVLIGISFRKNITLIVDGNISTVTTTALTIGSILRQEGIPINSTDMVIPGVEEWLKDGQVVRVGHASQVHIDVDDEGYDFVAHERLPTNMMAIAGIPLYPGDVILLDGDIISPENVLPYSFVLLACAEGTSYFLTGWWGNANIYINCFNIGGSDLGGGNQPYLF
jgi:hypothetical protein